MNSAPHVEVLITMIEDIRETAKTSEHGVIDSILKEVRETHKVVAENDLKALQANLEITKAVEEVNKVLFAKSSVLTGRKT